MPVFHNDLSRRGWLAGTASLGLAAAVPAVARPRRHRAHPPFGKIGVQLFTVRDAFTADPIATLKRVRRIGYDQVELFGLGGKSAGEIKACLDDTGLTAPSGHVSDWYNRAEASLDDLAAVGARYAVVAWMPVEERVSWEGFAARMNHWGELAKARGLRLAYHNHDFEFKPLADGRLGYDVLVSASDPDLVSFELDVYWAAHGGRDPVRTIREHARRIRLLHLKDMAADGSIVPVGQGRLDFLAILRAGHAAGVEDVFVEHDDPADPFGSIEASCAYLRQI